MCSREQLALNRRLDISTELQLNAKSLPDLSKAEESVASLSPDYLEVDSLVPNQVIRCFFLGVAEAERADKDTGELKTLMLATLAEQKENGEIVVWETAASQLVSVLKRQQDSGAIVPNYTALKITYKGMAKGKQYKYAKFDIKLLSVQPVQDAA